MRGKRILINPIDDYCDLKGEFIMATIVKPGTLHEKAGFIEYKMPEAMAKAYLNGRTAEEKRMRPNDFLCKIVNEEFGLKGYCTRVIRY